MLLDLSSWLTDPRLLWGLGCFSVLAVVATLLLVPRYLAGLPVDFLCKDASAAQGSLPLRIARNVLGAVLVLLGVAMLLLPGQGLLTLLVGLLLLDFPGKHTLVRRVLGRPKILGIINRLRAHRHVAPLEP